MSAGHYDFTIEQGTTFTLNLLYKDSAGDVIDLSNSYSVRMKIKESVGGTSFATGDSSDSSGTIQFTLGNASATNNIIATMSATNTASLDFEDAVYDLELVNGSQVDRVLQGRVTLSREVTV